MSDVDDCI